MSTNYYAEFSPGDPDAPISHVTRYHIGNSGMMQGRVFPTMNAWRDFLRHNQHFITLVDEYGGRHDVMEFIQEHLTLPAREPAIRQALYVQENSYNLNVEDSVPVNDRSRPVYWFDEGRVFYNGTFF